MWNHKLARLGFLLVGVFSSGEAFAAPPSLSASDSAGGGAVVYVYRVPGLFLSLRVVDLDVDRNPVLLLRNNECTAFRAAAGRHELNFEWMPVRNEGRELLPVSVENDFRAGQTYYYRFEARMTMLGSKDGIDWHVAPVDSVQANKEMAGCRYVPAGVAGTSTPVLLNIPAQSAVAPPEITAADAQAGKVGKPPPGKSLIVFFRPSGMASLLASSIKDGETPVSKIGFSSYQVYIAEPGVHEYWTQSEATAPLRMTLDAGETYYVKETVTLSPLGGRLHLSLSDKDSFEKVRASLRVSNWSRPAAKPDAAASNKPADASR